MRLHDDRPIGGEMRPRRPAPGHSLSVLLAVAVLCVAAVVAAVSINPTTVFLAAVVFIGAGLALAGLACREEEQ